ncbi:MAG TPA: type II secretion system protein [Gemmatimonadales bacterium]
MSRARKGFSLIELLVTLAVTAVLGTALARFVISNSRFVSLQETQMDARQVTRAAMNVMIPEFRRVTFGGITAATTSAVTVRSPIAFGTLCSDTVAAMLPTDSVLLASTVNGAAWRQTDGTYAFAPGVTVTMSGALSDCTADSIRVIPGGSLITISGPSLGPAGSIVYLYQQVRYTFEPSLVLTGRTALTRTVGGGSFEEILVPLGDSSGFRYLVGNNLTPQASPSFTDIRGIELRLVGESVATPRGNVRPSQYDVTVKVPFMNIEGS